MMVSDEAHSLWCVSIIEYTDIENAFFYIFHQSGFFVGKCRTISLQQTNKKLCI